MHRLLPFFVLLIAVCGFCAFFSPVRNKIISLFPNSVQEKIALTENTSSCADTAFNFQTGEFNMSAQVAYFNNQKVGYPKEVLAQANEPQNSVLGASDPNSSKWIEVSLEDQMLRAWDGNNVVDWYPISSGKWAPTVVGTFNIYWKLRYTRMVGGDKSIGTFYDLPNVPDTMYFYEGYGIHGAYWHHNFGNPMSHGCINEPLLKAHWLFEWAGPIMSANQMSMKATPENPGTKVCIHKGHLVSLSANPQAEACPPGISY